MALNFPASPSSGDLHNASNDLQYHFDGVKWTSQGVYNTSTINTLNFTQQGTGAVSRSVQNKLEEVISVKDFGATGDGTTDDAAAIQLAVNQLNTLAATAPATLYFPAGTYKIQAPIDFSLDDNDTFRREIVGGNGNMPVAKIIVAYHGYGSNLTSGNDKGAFYFGKKTNITYGYTPPFSLSGFLFEGLTTHKSPPAVECRGVAQSRIENITIDKIDNEAIILDSPQNNRLFNISIWNSGRSFKYKDRVAVTVTQNVGNTLTVVPTASFFEASDVGKNIAMWGANSHRRKTKITAVAVDGETATVEDSADPAISAAQNIIFGSPFIHNGGNASSTTITSDVATFSADDKGAYVWFKITGHDGMDCLLRRKITDYTSTTQVTIDSNLDVAISPSTAASGVIRCEIAVPALSIHSTHQSSEGVSGNSSDNKFINLQIESHKGVGVCAEDQSTLDFINTKIHAEQGTSDDIDAVEKYSVACMWLMQIDGSYHGSFEGQYIGRNKLWITGQTSTFTLINLLAGSAHFEKIIGIEKKNTSFDGASLVIQGLNVNHALPAHGLANFIEDANTNPVGYLMCGPVISQADSNNREITGHLTQNAYVEENGTKAPKLFINAANRQYSIFSHGGSGNNRFTLKDETTGADRIYLYSSGVFGPAGNGTQDLGLSGAKWKNIYASGLKVDGSQIDFTSLPTSDPTVAGRLWRSGNDVKISTG